MALKLMDTVTFPGNTNEVGFITGIDGLKLEICLIKPEKPKE